jgi:hypothetical protein
LAAEYSFLKTFYRDTSMKSLRCGGRQSLTLHPAGFDESEYCGGYAGLSHDSGVAPRVRKGTKTLHGRNARGMQGRLGDSGRHRLTRAKSDGFDYDEISYVDVIRMCIKAVVDYFRGILTGS